MTSRPSEVETPGATVRPVIEFAEQRNDIFDINVDELRNGRFE